MIDSAVVEDSDGGVGTKGTHKKGKWREVIEPLELAGTKIMIVITSIVSKFIIRKVVVIFPRVIQASKLLSFSL